MTSRQSYDPDPNIGTVSTVSTITNPVGVKGSDGSAIASTANPFPTQVKNLASAQWETIAASQTDQMMGTTGAAGDYLAGLLVVPATTSPGNVLIEDGAQTNVTVFTGGASSVSNLVPFYIPIGATSSSGGWEITTGANVSVIAFGNFT